MRSLRERWGECTIKKCGEDKEKKFDDSKSFSILPTQNQLSIFELKELFMLLIDLTEKFNYQELKNMLLKK